MNEKLSELSNKLLEFEEQRKDIYNQINNLEDMLEEINLRIDDVHNEMEFEYQLHKEQNN